jgi:maleylacetoacetate isomerase
MYTGTQAGVGSVGPRAELFGTIEGLAPVCLYSVRGRNMIFHGYFRSSAAHRCRIAFNLKRIMPTRRDHHLLRSGGEQRQASYAAINPQSLVPALEIPIEDSSNGKNDDVLTQSLAIIEWLDEVYPEPSLLPGDPLLRAQIRAFSQVIACDIHPLQNLRVLQYLKNDLGHDQADADRWCQRWIGDGLAACEALLARGGNPGKFCFGSTPTLADICLVPQVYSAKRFGVDLTEMPRIQAIFASCEKLEAFQSARPENQPDAES